MKISSSSILSFFAFVLGCSALAGNRCVWTGAGGDGKWSNASNWTVAPVSGNKDELSFEGGDLVTENDIEGMSVAGIRCTGSGTKTFNGKDVTITGQAFKSVNSSGNSAYYDLSNSCNFVYNNNVKINGDIRMVLEPDAEKAVFNGDVTVLPGKKFRIGYPYTQTRDKGKSRPYYFNGKLDAPEGTVVFSQWSQSDVHLKGSVDIGVCDFEYPSSRIILPSKEGSVRIRNGLIDLWYGFVKFIGPNTFCSDSLPVLSWRTTGGYYEDKKGHYELNVSQTIDRLGAGRDVSDNKGNSITSSTGASLTMKATANSSTWGIVCGSASIVWDPVSDYSLTFKKRESNTTGSITVKGGEVALAEGAKFSQLSKIEISSGASFFVNTESANPLEALSELVMAGDSRFTVAEGLTGAFSLNQRLALRLSSGARLSLPAGFSQNVFDFTVNGVPMVPGVYTGTGGTEGTVIPQIAGTGKIVVAEKDLTSWQNSNGGNWSATANWSAGFPSTREYAYIVKSGTYEVELDADASAENLIVAGAEGNPVLSVSGKRTFAFEDVLLEANGIFSVKDSGDLELVSPNGVKDSESVITVRNGGMFASEGTCVASNMYGRIKVEQGGLMRVTGGTFIVAPPKLKQYSTTIDLDGGTLAVTNATMVLGYDFNSSDGNSKGDYVTLRVGNGAKFFLHDSTLKLNQWFTGTFFGTGTGILSGNSKMSWHKYVRGAFTADNAGETCRVYLYDNASICDGQEFAVCDDGEGTVSILNMESPGVKIHNFSGTQIGCNNGYGEVNVNAGYFQTGTSYGLHIGYKSPRAQNCAATGFNPVGRMRVNGGAVYVSARDAVSSPKGLIVGNGDPVVYQPSGVTSKFTGYLEISGDGVITNYSRFIVGMAYAYGRVTMTGGKVVGLKHSNKEYSLNNAIGLGGGEGEWIQTGGSATFATSVFVGGGTMNQMEILSASNPVYTERRHAKGLLEVTGGTFAVNDADLYVSALGEGKISVSGSGAISARDIILTNTVDEAGVNCVATLKAVVDADGNAGSVTASGTFYIQDDSRFVFDLSTYEGSKSTFPVVRAGAVSGRFAAENVEISGNGSKYAILRQTETSVDVVVNRGLVLYLK